MLDTESIESADGVKRDPEKGINNWRSIVYNDFNILGMSGSPIIRDGKLIGAVTHVLGNDPTRGYGIFIESMLKN